MAIQRRSLVTAAAASLLPLPRLAAPALAANGRDRTLVFVPQTSLASLDPLWSSQSGTIYHGYCAFDTLYGVDSQYRPHPQMAEGHEVSDDGRTWLIRLRPGLRFHDNEPVLARDCIASLIRWSKQDVFGATLAAAVDGWDSVDDRTIRIRLERPFPPLLDALAHPHTYPTFIMPERLAKTDPRTQIMEIVGSGPWVFLKDEFVAGSRSAYARFDGYVPRAEPPDHTSGGKVVHFDRLEWQVIPDPATSAAALAAGEVDWLELVLPDLLPSLLRSPKVRSQVSDPLGFVNYLRFNCLIPPFDNPRLRRVVASAVNQEDFMRAIMGDDGEAWRECRALFACGLPGIKEEGAALMGGPKDLAKLRADVLEAGYKGERIVLMNPVDRAYVAPMGVVAADMLRKLGMNVDLQELEWGAAIVRRASKEPVERGGWNIVASYFVTATIVNPLSNVGVRGEGRQSGWPGWYENPQIEALVQDWLVAPGEAERTAIDNRIQALAFLDPPTVPLGQYFARTAFRSDLSGILPGSIVSTWNIRRG